MKRLILLFMLLVAVRVSVMAAEKKAGYQWSGEEWNAIDHTWWDQGDFVDGAIFEIEPGVFYEPYTRKEYRLDSIVVPLTSGEMAYRFQIDSRTPDEGTLKRMIMGFGINFAWAGTAEYIELPETVEWEGKEYRVVALEDDPGWQAKKLEIPSSVRYINSNCYDRGNMTEIVFNEGLETVMDNVFTCSEVDQFVFPRSLRSIGSESFYDCPKLEKVEFNEGLASIGIGSFSKCPMLTEVTLPASLKSLGKNSFNDCEVIGKVTMSRWISNRSGFEGIFNGCPNIKEIVYESNTPLEAKNCFDKVNKEECTLYVPYRRAYLYAVLEGWKEFKNIVELPQRPDALDENGHLAVGQVAAEIDGADEGYYTLEGLRYEEWNEIPHGTTIIHRNQKILKR